MIDIEEIRQLREQGYTLQAIGDKVGLTREGIRQLLVKNWGTTKFSALVPRETFAKLLGCSVGRLNTLEKKGLVNPIHLGYRYLYGEKDSKKILGLLNPMRPPLVERTCEECGKKFYLRASSIRPHSPGRFCSKRCQGDSFGHRNGK